MDSHKIQSIKAVAEQKYLKLFKTDLEVALWWQDIAELCDDQLLTNDEWYDLEAKLEIAEEEWADSQSEAHSYKARVEELKDDLAYYKKKTKDLESALNVN